MANCTNCGTQLKDGVKFCTECGTVVPESRQEVSPAPQAPPPSPQPQAAEPPLAPPPSPQPQAAEPPLAPPPSPQPQAAEPQQAPPPPPPPPQSQPVYQQQAYAPPVQEQPPGPDSPYALISTWGFIGIMLLLCIPVVGFILMIVWACGGCKKYQKRNLSRAMLIVMAVTMAVSLIMSLVVYGFVKSAVDMVKEQVSAAFETEDTGTSDDGWSALAALFSDGGTPEEEEPAASNGTDGTDILSSLFGGLLGGGDTSGENDDGDISGDVSGLLAGLFGGDLSGLLAEVEDINSEAAQNADGWPSDLPDYPDGTMNEAEEYRTLITGSSAESMWDYVETLKRNGYQFQDFYDFGMSEADMKSMNAWWGTNGAWYLSISYADGTVTVDHTTELPDMSGLFG